MSRSLWCLRVCVLDAQTITVNTDRDDFNTPSGTSVSLREAIRDANEDPTANDVVVFDSSLSGQTIRITKGTLDIDKNLTIDGSGLPDGIRISGDVNQNGELDGGDKRVFRVGSGHTVEFKNVHIHGGFGQKALFVSTSDDGGGILNDGGFITITGSTFSGNGAKQHGGGIFNDNNGTIDLINSTLVDNEASDQGGGLFNNGGTVTLNHGTVSGNSATNDGGGLFNDQGTVTIRNTIFGNNGSDIDINGGTLNTTGVNIVALRQVCWMESCRNFNHA